MPADFMATRHKIHMVAATAPLTDELKIGRGARVSGKSRKSLERLLLRPSNVRSHSEIG